jgi:predicted TPR repeat methyltransferase
MDRYKITFNSWDKVASVYQDYFMDLELYNDTFDIFCQLLEKPNARIFEIACGPGNITKYLLSKRPDFKIEAIDISPNMIELAKINNPQADFKVMDCREIDKLDEKFDAIMCGFCMPYLSKQDCEKLVKDSANLLNAGGIFYFSVIEGNYENSGYETGSSGQDKMYVYYHQQNYLQKYLEVNNFELLQLIRKSYTKADGSLSTQMIFIAKKTSG